MLSTEVTADWLRSRWKSYWEAPGKSSHVGDRARLRSYTFLILGAIGLASAAMMDLEAAQKLLSGRIGIRILEFVTVNFSAMLAVAMGYVLQRNYRDSRRKSVEDWPSPDLKGQTVASRLQRSEERMAMAIEAAKLGFFDWDCISNEQAWSEQIRPLLGLPQDTPATFEVLMFAVHPADREALQRCISGLSADNPEFTLEHRACWADGSVHWIWVKGRGSADANGTLVRVSGILMNIDERRQAEESYRLQATALREAANAVVITECTGTIQWVNPAFEQMTGYTAEEVMGKNPRILKSGKHDAAFYKGMWRTISAGEVWRGEVDNRKKDGSLYSEEMTVAPVRSQDGDISHFVAIKHDTTERKQAQEALQTAESHYRRMFENSVLGIFQITPEGRFIRVNPALARLAGYDSPQEFLDQVSSVLGLYVDLERRKELLARLAAGHPVSDFELEMKHKSGEVRAVLLRVHSVTGAGGTVLHNEGTVEDITERKRAEERVRYLAYHDALTGLPNSTMFEGCFAQALVEARGRNGPLALLWIDIDNFKFINDSLGHSVGDALLREIGQRLQGLVRDQDTVARVGGDEFLMLLTKIHDPSQVNSVADRIRSELGREYVLEGRQINVTCSVGSSVFPKDGADKETLMRNADQALYAAKDSGRNTVRSFTHDMDQHAAVRILIGTKLRTAAVNDELSLVYQPEVEVATGRVIAAEALLRWHNPQLGQVSPDRFIPVAENNGLIIPIGEWGLKAACTQIRRWQDYGLRALPIAVNVSTVQLRQKGFVDAVSRILRETGVAPQLLELEITEGVLMANIEEALVTLQDLASLGLRLSIDDFGTGYSSLSYLKDLPVFKLKIDRSFVRSLPTSARNAAITRTIITMAANLHIKVLAEGVQTAEQLDFLRAHGCDEAQGYFFSRPMAVDQLTHLLAGPAILPPCPDIEDPSPRAIQRLVPENFQPFTSWQPKMRGD